MEKNNYKINILKNLQKTLNLIEKIDLTGGNRDLDPDKLSEIIEQYQNTKREIIETVNNIIERFTVVKRDIINDKEYIEHSNGINRRLQNQVSEANRLASSRKLENDSLVEQNAELQRNYETAASYNREWEERYNELDEVKNQLNTDYNEALREKEGLVEAKTLADDSLNEVLEENRVLSQENIDYSEQISQISSELDKIRQTEADMGRIGSMVRKLGEIIGRYA